LKTWPGDEQLMALLREVKDARTPFERTPIP
jgi:hypothetical protein